MRKASSQRQFSDLWIYLALLAFTFAVYLPVFQASFINYDDPDYVSQNIHVRQGITADGINWAFTSGEAANWFPVTRLSHMLDVQIFGTDAGLHHVENVIWHALAALLLFAFLNRATRARWPSAFVAFLFALHPLHVESVAWIAERKDVFCAFFAFLTLLLWVRYTEKPDARLYSASLAAFALGLMSKPMIVTLPLLMLLLDVWPLRRALLTKPLLREKIPFFALSAAGAITTYLVQQSSGAVRTLEVLPFPLRLENAFVSYVVYIAKLFWPTRLAVFYPYPQEIPMWQPIAAAGVLIAVTVLAVRDQTRPYLAVGWLWYLIALLPVIGLIQVGEQARADRYMYLPMVGLTIMLSWGAVDALNRFPRVKPIIAALAATACITCAAVSFAQAGYWKTSESLFAHALQVTDENYVAHHNFGVAIMDQPGRVEEAIAHFQTALRIRPDSVRVHTDLGNALSKIPSRLPDAIAEYREAIRISPDAAIPHNNLGYALAASGQTSEAIAEFQTALRIDPDYQQARDNLAAVQRAVSAPANDSADAHYESGMAFAKAGRTTEAISELEKALELRPNYAEAHNNLGVILSSVQGHTKDAITHFQAAIRIQPDYADAHFNLGVALANTPGRLPDAIKQLEEAQRLRPDPEVAHALDQLRAVH